MKSISVSSLVVESIQFGVCENINSKKPNSLKRPHLKFSIGDNFVKLNKKEVLELKIFINSWLKE